MWIQKGKYPNLILFCQLSNPAILPSVTGLLLGIIIFESPILRYMKSILSLALAILFGLEQGIAQEAIVLMNVNVISMRDSSVAMGKTVVIRNNKIAAIENFDPKKTYKKLRVIDGKGAYLIPGLFDMHMHFYHDHGLAKKYLKDEIKMPLANGVTTVRIMNGRPEYLQLKKDIGKGKILGPEMFVASPQLVGRWPFKDSLVGKIVSNSKDAEDAVKLYKAQGYDAIKITTLVNMDAYNGIVTTAEKQNIRVIGHWPPISRSNILMNSLRRYYPTLPLTMEILFLTMASGIEREHGLPLNMWMRTRSKNSRKKLRLQMFTLLPPTFFSRNSSPLGQQKRRLKNFQTTTMFLSL